MSASFYRGTGIDQNVKFKNKDKAMIQNRTWPPEFDEPVDLTKVGANSVSPPL